ncbi:MAG: carbohydrate porin, partial [Planctomycetes bacterium]|nr:carbohydrate porin [Planctomycetota bacterium]
DPERIGLAPGTILFYAQNGHGNGISERHVGDAQTLSNLEACYLSQISEYWIEQLYFDERLRIKLGKQDSNVDFVAVDYGGIHAGSSFAVIPNIPMPTFPNPALGAAAFWDVEDWITLGAGFYEGDPEGCHSGFDTAFGENNGSFTIGEVALKSLFGEQKDLPGTYRFGGWYHSSDFEEVGDDADPDLFAGNHGYYLAFDQMLYRENDESDQGLGAFFQLGLAPKDRNELDRYLGIGLNYVGLLHGRDEDVIGLGIAQAHWSERIDDTTRETAIELFYKAQLTKSIAIQPDLQYIINPSGNGDDALAFGVRFEIVF